MENNYVKYISKFYLVLNIFECIINKNNTKSLPYFPNLNNYVTVSTLLTYQLHELLMYLVYFSCDVLLFYNGDEMNDKNEMAGNYMTSHTMK